MKIWMMAVLAIALWKPATAQVAGQITQAAAPKLSASANVKENGTTSITINEERDGKTRILESSVLRVDGSLESETDSFFSGSSPSGSMTTRFDAQSRLIEYSIADGAGKTTTTRVAPSSAKTARRIKYFSKTDETGIVYSLTDLGRVQKKEVGRRQQNAQIVALYNARGVRREISVRQNDQPMVLVLRYNDKNKLKQADFSGKESAQMTFVYNASGHPTETKMVSGKDVMRTVTTYNEQGKAQGKAQEMTIYNNDILQMRWSYGYDEQGRPTLSEIRDGSGKLKLQYTTTYDAAGKAGWRTVVFDADGTETVISTSTK